MIGAIYDFGLPVFTENCWLEEIDHQLPFRGEACLCGISNIETYASCDSYL